MKEKILWDNRYPIQRVYTFEKKEIQLESDNCGGVYIHTPLGKYHDCVVVVGVNRLCAGEIPEKMIMITGGKCETAEIICEY
jgi:hypothetical protein